MREIKFRGRDKYGNWYVGGYRKSWMYDENHFPQTTTYIVKDFEEEVQVDPKSIGQYTGLKDKNGREIYEGDIIRILFKGARDGVVEYDEARCRFVSVTTIEDGSEWYMDINYRHEIVGNIHDNPELLEK